MRPKSLILLSLALGCGLVAALGINQMMAKQGPVAPTGEVQDVVVAVRDVNINDLVQRDALKLEPWPKDKVPPGALTALEDVEGRRAKTKIYSGEPLLEVKLLSKGDAGQSPTDYIPLGFRVVSVRVDAVSATGNMIKPGDRVDVIVHINQSSRGLCEPTSKTFLQDVRVFAVNDLIDRDPANGGSKITAQTISLLVKPEDVELVTLASEMGKIRLSMRGPGDEERSATDGAVATDLLSPTKNHNRDEEAPPPSGVSNPLTEWLDRLKQGPQAALHAAEEPPGHKITMLVGPEVREFEFDQRGALRMVRPQPAVAPAPIPPAPPSPTPPSPTPGEAKPAPTPSADNETAEAHDAAQPAAP